MAKLNLGGATSGAASGAATGAAFGGLPGSILGGLFGGITGLFGRKKKAKKRSTLDKRQQQLNEAQSEGIFGRGPLADLYNYDPEKANAVFDQNVARKAYRDFNEKLAPGITGNFRSKGLENSSYVAEALGRTGRDVQENLDALRSQTLYNTENQAREARRNAIENFQNRNTMAYDVNNGGFDIGDVLNSVPKEIIDELVNRYGSKRNTGGL